ncbi:hypothetical protein [Clostridioides sp. ZZV15-6597]|uniref:hypothetical protein n=1 Tax=Clostridioides sp. ZZV15-6597 TaxID=2811500 RepID=UPI001D105313|nr:hypothetical protein [Clostridioides sp. ZZV15-6597]
MKQSTKIENEFIKNRWTLDVIEKEKKVTRIIRYFLTTLSIIALFTPVKIKFSIYISILLFSWMMYLCLYPKMLLEIPKTKESIKYHIPFPLTACVLSMLILLLSTSSLNTPNNERFSFAGIYMIVLLIPYALVLIIKKRHETKLKTLLVTLSTFILSFSTTPALNYITTLDKPEFELVTVVDKEINPSRSGNDYYLKINVKNKIKKMKVSNNMYDSTNKNNSIQLCKRKSIFGYEYWTLYK